MGKSGVQGRSWRFLLISSRGPGSVLALLLHSPPHEPSHRRQVGTEVLGDFPIGVSARGIGRHSGGVSFTAILGNLRQRRGWGAALRLRNAQAVTRDLRVALHAQCET